MKVLLGFYNNTHLPVEVSFTLEKIDFKLNVPSYDFIKFIIPCYHYEHIKTTLIPIYTNDITIENGCFFNYLNRVIWFSGVLSGTITLDIPRDYHSDLIIEKHLLFLKDYLNLDTIKFDNLEGYLQMMNPEEPFEIQFKVL
jgi:hypothetical protein